jgi:hypothetical protein
LQSCWSRLKAQWKRSERHWGACHGQIKTEDEAGYDLAAQGITQGKGRGGSCKIRESMQDQIEKGKEAVDAAKIAARKKRKGMRKPYKKLGN